MSCTGLFLFLFGDPRQIDLYAGPLLRFAVNIDKSIILLDYAICGGKAETGSLAYILLYETPFLRSSLR